jgi:DNA repair protein RadC
MKEFLQRKKSIDLSVRFIELNDNLQTFRIDELADCKLIAEKCKSQAESLLNYASMNKRYITNYLSRVNAIFDAQRIAENMTQEIEYFEREYLGARS